MNDSLLDQYKKQWNWRDWDSLYSQLPDLSGVQVFDLGCAHGDHSEKLSYLGASVVGLDGNQELLNYAIKRNLPNVNFQKCDLNEIDNMNLEQADGVWISFVAAYFTDFNSFLEKIKQILKPGGWIAITEMSGLFEHQPLENKYQIQIKKFYDHMLEN